MLPASSESAGNGGGRGAGRWGAGSFGKGQSGAEMSTGKEQSQWPGLTLVVAFPVHCFSFIHIIIAKICNISFQNYYFDDPPMITFCLRSLPPLATFPLACHLPESIKWLWEGKGKVLGTEHSLNTVLGTGGGT